MRALYHPIQPTVNDESEVSYVEFFPNDKLKPYIHCYWQLRTKQTLKERYVYRVVADGCIDLFFDANFPSLSFVMGFYRKYNEFDIGKKFNYIGVRFYPSYFSQVFNVDARTLSNQTTKLELIHPEVANGIAELFGSIPTLHEIPLRLNIILGQFINEGLFSEDARFYDALKTIYEKNGLLETELELNTGLSPRQLRRIFNQYIGTTAKSFSKVIRFQSVISALQKETINPSVYLDAGFYDQAHFIKDFKNYYGITPSKAYQ